MSTVLRVWSSIYFVPPAVGIWKLQKGSAHVTWHLSVNFEMKYEQKKDNSFLVDFFEHDVRWFLECISVGCFCVSPLLLYRRN